jgi:glutathione S-transferase
VVTSDNRKLGKIKENIGLDVIPRHLGYLERIMQKSSTGWIANTEGPSIADFMLAPRLVDLHKFVEDELMFDVLYAYPGLREMREKLFKLPSVTWYINKQFS